MPTEGIILFFPREQPRQEQHRAGNAGDDQQRRLIEALAAGAHVAKRGRRVGRG